MGFYGTCPEVMSDRVSFRYDFIPVSYRVSFTCMIPSKLISFRYESKAE